MSNPLNAYRWKVLTLYYSFLICGANMYSTQHDCSTTKENHQQIEDELMLLRIDRSQFLADDSHMAQRGPPSTVPPILTNMDVVDDNWRGPLNPNMDVFGFWGASQAGRQTIDAFAASKPEVRVAATPPLAWSSWYSLTRGSSCDGPENSLSQSAVLETAQALVKTGLAARGFNTMILDDCWQAEAKCVEFHLKFLKFPGTSQDPGHSRETSGTFPGNVQEFSRTFPGLLEHISAVFREFFGSVPGNFRGISIFF